MTEIEGKDFDHGALDPQAIFALSEALYAAGAPELWAQFQREFAAAVRRVGVRELRLELERASVSHWEFSQRYMADENLQRGIEKAQRALRSLDSGSS